MMTDVRTLLLTNIKRLVIKIGSYILASPDHTLNTEMITRRLRRKAAVCPHACPARMARPERRSDAPVTVVHSPPGAAPQPGQSSSATARRLRRDYLLLGFPISPKQILQALSVDSKLVGDFGSNLGFKVL